MKIKLTLIAAFGLLFTGATKAQTPETPPDPKIFKDTANCRKFESKVKEYVEWTIKTPCVNKDVTLWKKVDDFIWAWTNGSSDVTVTIGKVIEPILEDKKDKGGYELLIAYMGGIAVYELENRKDKDEVNIEYAGLKAMLEMVKINGNLFTNAKAVKKYQGMDDNALKKYVADCLTDDKKGK